MIKLLFRKKNMKAPKSGWLAPQSGSTLLDTPYRQQVIKSVWDLTSLTRPVFEEFVLGPLTRYAELVQLLPASESHHHAYAGGMLDHGLEVVSYALRLRRQHLLPPGATPEEQSAMGERWTIAIAYAALLHDVAKILVDIEVHLEDGRVWRLWQGTIPTHYRVVYRKGRDYQLHQASNPLLCQQILGSRALDWLYGDPAVFAQLMYTITGHEHLSGVIGEIVAQADRSSVAKALGGDPSRALQAPVESLQRKVVEALRYLVKEQLSMNTPGAPAYLTEEALWIVAPAVPNQLKSYLLQHGVGGVPSQTTRLYDEMQAHGLIIPASEGKSVWKCEVSIGDWTKTLSFLKVPPGVIWGASDERPPALVGEVCVVGAEAAKEDKADAVEPHASPGARPAEVQPPMMATPETPHQQVDTANTVSATSTDDLNIDDMISLITGEKLSESPVGSDAEAAQNEQPAAPTPAPDLSPQEGSSVRSAPDLDLGQRFVAWLEAGLAARKIAVNDAKAAVHVVDDTYFLVSPGIFRRFCNLEFGTDKQWSQVQKKFQKLGLHRKTKHNTNIFDVAVDGKNRKGAVLKGYLLKKEQKPSLTPCAQSNIYLSLITSEVTQDA